MEIDGKNWKLSIAYREIWKINTISHFLWVKHWKITKTPILWERLKFLKENFCNIFDILTQTNRRIFFSIVHCLSSHDHKKNSSLWGLWKLKFAENIWIWRKMGGFQISVWGNGSFRFWTIKFRRKSRPSDEFLPIGKKQKCKKCYVLVGQNSVFLDFNARCLKINQFSLNVFTLYYRV